MASLEQPSVHPAEVGRNIGRNEQSWKEDAAQILHQRRALITAYGIPILVIGAVFFFYFSSMRSELKSFNGNYSGFVRFAEFRAEKVEQLQRSPQLRKSLIIRDRGYDGQFYYYIALDPFLLYYKDTPSLYREVVDSARYRYERIGFPLLINIFSLDHPELYAQTMIWLILAGQAVGVFFLWKIAAFFQRSPLWALLYVLVPGFLISLHLALPEPIAAAFLLGGVFFYLKERFPTAMLFFAFSILIRETTILYIGILVLVEGMQRKRIAPALLLGCSVIPYVAWKAYLTWRLFSVYGWSTFLFGPRDFAMPFQGMLEMYLSRWTGAPAQVALCVFGSFVLMNLLLGVWLTMLKRDSFALAVLGYSILHVCLNYTRLWSGTRSIERTTYEAFLFLLVAFLAQSGQTARSFKYALLVLGCAIACYDVLISLNAPFFRAGLHL